MAAEHGRLRAIVLQYLREQRDPPEHPINLADNGVTTCFFQQRGHNLTRSLSEYLRPPGSCARLWQVEDRGLPSGTRVG